MPTTSTTAAAEAFVPRLPDADAAPTPSCAGYQVIRRNGSVVAFVPDKIAVALMKAFLAVHGTQGAASASVRETVDALTLTVVRALMRSRPAGGTFHIEDVQDQVELGLMRGGHHEVARAYVLYRERRAQERAKQGAPVAKPEPVMMRVRNCPALPTNGSPSRSSSAPGASPTNATSGSIGPTPKTV
jgi:ribonucleoside-diphosphate reductase alpha chain